MKYFPFILLIILSISTSPLYAQYSTEQGNAARNIWLKGFEVFENAETAKKNGDNKSSVSLYQESLTYFQKVKKQFPQWNSALVEYRIRICSSEIRSLSIPGAMPPVETVSATTTPVATAPVKTTIPVANADAVKESSELREKLGLTEKALRDTRKRLDSALVSLDEARKEAATGGKSKEEIQSLIMEKNELEKKTNMLSEELKRLKDLAANPAAGELARQLQSENEKLKKELEATGAKAEKDALERTNLSNTVDIIGKKAAETEASLESARKNTARLLDENKALKTQIEAQSKQSEAVKVQFETLKKDLEKSSELVKENLELIATQADLAKNMETVSKERDDLKKKADSLAVSLGKLGNKEKEFAELSKQYASLEEKSRKLDEANASLQKDRDVLKASMEKEKLDLQEKLAKSSKEAEELGRKLKELAGTPAAGELAKQLQSENEKLKKKVAESAIETAAGQKSISQLSDENKSLKAEAQSLSGSVDKLGKKEKEFTELSKQYASLEEKSRKLDEANASLQKDRDALKVSTEKEKQDLQEKLAKSSREAEELGRKMKDLAGTPAAGELAKQLQSENEKLKKELQDKAESAEQLRIERDDFKVRLMQKTAEAESLKKANEKIKAEKTVTVEKIIKEPVNEKAKPNEAEISILLKAGEEADKKGSKDLAISQYGKALSMDPENQQALSKLSILYSDRGNDEMTLKYVERSLRYQPNDVQNLLIAGSAYIRKGEYYLAIGVLGRGVAQDPKNPKLQRYLGVACSNLDWIEAAEKQFKTAFDLDPKSSESALYLAILYATSEKPKMDEARKWYKKSRELGAKTDPAIEKLIKE
ncbi:MAG: hypothetical protein WAX69_23185 [Victivallales bacterium]